MEKVSILKVISGVEKTLVQTLENLQLDLKRATEIIIKPNLCCYLHPSTGATTDVRFIDALIKVITNLNDRASICIVESDSQGKRADVAFKVLGYELLEKKHENVRLINLTKDEKIRKNVDSFYFKEFPYPKTFLGEHFFISVPKLKTLDVDYMTCALKNQYGCNPYPKKWFYHYNLPEVIYDLNKLFPPDLIIVDGITAMEGSGPSAGIPKKTDIIIGGEKPASVDVVAAGIMGIPYKKVKYLKFALKHGGLGTDKVEKEGDIHLNERFILPRKPIVKMIIKRIFKRT